MGSGTSRGKKVAPARVSEVSVARTVSGPDSRPRKPRRVRASARNERDRAQPAESHSDGHDSDLSAEDDEGEVARKTRPRTYGLCHFSREDAEDDGAEGPRGSRGASGDVNNRSDDAFTHFQQRTTQCQGLSHVRTSYRFILENINYIIIVVGFV